MNEMQIETINVGKIQFVADSDFHYRTLLDIMDNIAPFKVKDDERALFYGVSDEDLAYLFASAYILQGVLCDLEEPEDN